MSELQLYPFEFRGNTVHTLTLDGRPAWIAREIGEALGYAREGKRLVNKIKGEWKYPKNDRGVTLNGDFTLKLQE